MVVNVKYGFGKKLFVRSSTDGKLLLLIKKRYPLATIILIKWGVRMVYIALLVGCVVWTFRYDMVKK